MTKIPGDWVERQWCITSEDTQEHGDHLLVYDVYTEAVKRMDYLIEHMGRGLIKNLTVFLQERQFIPDDQCWGEWVTIMKSEGVPK